MAPRRLSGMGGKQAVCVLCCALLPGGRDGVEELEARLARPT